MTRAKSQPEAEAMLEQRAVFSAPSLSVYLNHQPTAVAQGRTCPSIVIHPKTPYTDRNHHK